MHTPASIAGHPIHPMLVPIAIGGFVLSFAFDVVGLSTGTLDPWRTLALWTMVGGIVGALAAAVPGLIDLLSLESGEVKGTAVTHMLINLTVVALYIVNAYIRYKNADPGVLPAFLSLAGIGMLLVSGWLGGKMVFRAGVGVEATR